MSPVLAAALARAEAAAGDLVGVPADTGATAPRRASRTPGRFFGISGCFGHSTRVGEAQRGGAQRGEAQRGEAQRGGAQRGDGQRGEVQRGGARRGERRGR